jgi:hypothetical protein
MADPQSKVRDVAWGELFPWLMLVRSVRIALFARVLMLGALGLIVTTLGWKALGWVFSGSRDAAVQQWIAELSPWVWEETAAFAIPMTARNAGQIFLQVYDEFQNAPPEIWLYFTQPFRGMFSDVSALAFLYLLLCAVWELVVWGLVGGAITRIAALRFTRDEAPGPVAALKHAVAKLPSYSLPPLVALAGAAIFAIQLAVLGLFMRLDFLAFLAALIWPFVLMLGLLMAILLLGALIGWPFMWATISVEGTDAFDALSRSYAYTYQRPWRLLWYVLFVTLLAAISMFVVKMFAASAIALGDWSVDWGLDNETMREVVRPVNTTADDPTALPPPAVPPVDGDVATGPSEANAAVTDEEAGREVGMFRSGTRRAVFFWKSLMAALAAGYQAGFLWVSAVGVYLLLRRDIDGVQTTEVYLDQDEGYGMPPLTGDALSGVPEVAPTGAAQPGDASNPNDLPRTD